MSKSTCGLTLTTLTLMSRIKCKYCLILLFIIWLAPRAGKMEPSCLLGTIRCIPQAKFHQKPYNKSFIDQVCSVKMAGYWPRSFFLRVYGPRLRLGSSTRKEEHEELGQYPAILTKQTWSITHTYFSFGEITTLVFTDSFRVKYVVFAHKGSQI